MAPAAAPRSDRSQAQFCVTFRGPCWSPVSETTANLSMHGSGAAPANTGCNRRSQRQWSKANELVRTFAERTTQMPRSNEAANESSSWKGAEAWIGPRTALLNDCIPGLCRAVFDAGSFHNRAIRLLAWCTIARIGVGTQEMPPKSWQLVIFVVSRIFSCMSAMAMKQPACSDALCCIPPMAAQNPRASGLNAQQTSLERLATLLDAVWRGGMQNKAWH